MSIRLSIRLADLTDLEALTRLRRECLLDAGPDVYHKASELETRGEFALREQILDRCVLLGLVNGRAVAMNTLDLDAGAMADTLVAPDWRLLGLGRRMVAELERLAVRFGMARLTADAPSPAIEFFTVCGYQPAPGARLAPDVRTGIDSLHMERRFPRRQTRYGKRISRLLASIGISPDYGRIHRLMLQEECSELATIGRDVHDREQQLEPGAARAWYRMRNGALQDGIDLEVVSAYRSVGYQVNIIERKKQAGQTLERILEVSAAPGFSEHHTGRAVDLSTPGSDPLELEFETTPAFEWLVEGAGNFGFRMSYPRHNRHRIAFEPWHWLFINE